LRKTGRITAYLILLTGMLALGGCTNSLAQDPPETTQVTATGPVNEGGIILYGPGDYDSVDTPILMEINTEEKTLTFLNTTVSRQYTLSYDGITEFSSQYGDAYSVSQFKPGDIVDVKFVKSKKYLTSMSVGAEVWEIEDTDQYEFDYVKKNVIIGPDTYKISNDAVYLADGAFIQYRDLNTMDNLTFRGVGTTVYSVELSKGHGYLRLKGHEYFVGGLIEVGSKLVTRVTEDMLITMPEGTYSVMISNGGTTVDRSVLIRRGEETKLDLSDVVIEAPKTGMVLFSLSPSNAELYIDGEKTDASQAVVLTYGMHQLICRAEGYKSVTKYFTVGQDSAGLNITLEEGEGESTSDDTTSTTYYKVYIDAPEGAEVYLDGTYVGVAPCSFRKEEGSHVVTLSKTGYVTRSYTVTVDGEDKDVSFSFVDLVEQPSVSE
jgi:hypothetical protein